MWQSKPLICDCRCHLGTHPTQIDCWGILWFGQNAVSSSRAPRWRGNRPPMMMSPGALAPGGKDAEVCCIPTVTVTPVRKSTHRYHRMAIRLVPSRLLVIILSLSQTTNVDLYSSCLLKYLSSFLLTLTSSLVITFYLFPFSPSLPSSAPSLSLSLPPLCFVFFLSDSCTFFAFSQPLVWYLYTLLFCQVLLLSISLLSAASTRQSASFTECGPLLNCFQSLTDTLSSAFLLSSVLTY